MRRTVKFAHVAVRGLVGYLVGWHAMLLVLELVGWGVLDVDTPTTAVVSYLKFLRFLVTPGFELVALLQASGFAGILVALGHLLWSSARRRK